MRFLLIFILILFGGCQAEKQRGDRSSFVYVKPKGYTGSEERVALVIGNSDYKYMQKLKNPTNDSRDMRKKLRLLGFDVRYLENGTKAEMMTEMRKFQTDFQDNPNVVTFFYYAGHGKEFNGKNYLVPIEANAKAPDEWEEYGVKLSFMLRKFHFAQTKLNIAVLDACRTGFRGDDGFTSPSQAEGTLVAYSTGIGNTASDNEREENGLYTKYLLKNLERENMELLDIFRKTTEQVSKSSAKEQVPWFNTSITSGKFYFLGDGKTQNSDEVAPKVITKEVVKFIEKPVEKIVTKEVVVVDDSRIRELERELAQTKKALKQVQRETPKNVNKETPKNVNKETPKNVNAELDSVWIDPETNLMWQNEPFTKADKKHYDDNTEGGRALKWENAKNYCSNLELAGYSDWKLPSRDELKTLLTKKKNGWLYIKKPMLKNTEILRGGKYNNFTAWTSTIMKTYSSTSWVVHFGNGNDSWNGQTNFSFAVCVRDL
ncbi:hypothetical protein ThvES_00019100 [Thiovulum sp. ES]|nr:hypothetical protein ThvES_00019100 [Thiovulum sp. ES]